MPSYLPKPDGKIGPASPMPAQQFRRTQHEGTTVLEIQGDLEGEDLSVLRDVLLQNIGSGNAPSGDIALDMSRVTFLSEQALALLVHALKAQRARGAVLRIIHPSLLVRKKLARTALLTFFVQGET